MVEPVVGDFFLVHGRFKPTPKAIRISDFLPVRPAVKTKNTFGVLETKGKEEFHMKSTGKATHNVSSFRKRHTSSTCVLFRNHLNS